MMIWRTVARWLFPETCQFCGAVWSRRADAHRADHAQGRADGAGCPCCGYHRQTFAR